MKTISIFSIIALVAGNLVSGTNLCVNKPGYCDHHNHLCSHHPHKVCKRQQQQQQQQPQNPFGSGQNPLDGSSAQQQNPFGSNSQPNPFGSGQNPFGNNPQQNQAAQPQLNNDPQATQQIPQGNNAPAATQNTQSIPASIFNNLPSFLGINFPGLAASPTATTAGNVSVQTNASNDGQQQQVQEQANLSMTSSRRPSSSSATTSGGRMVAVDGWMLAKLCLAGILAARGGI